MYKKELLELASHLEGYILQQKRAEKLRRIDNIFKQNLRQEKLIEIKKNSK